MTDDVRDLHDSADGRDERLAALLQPESLDEVTRARLVRTAMAAVPPSADRSSNWPGRVRWLAVAAAVVAFLAVGLTVVLRDDSASGPSAVRAPRAADAEQEGAASPSGTIEDFSADQDRLEQSLQALGDLGDIGSPAALRRAIESATASTAATADASASSPSANRLPRTTKRSCSTGKVDRMGRRVAVGTGTVRGKPVTVFVVERADGTRVAVTVDAACGVGEPVSL